MQAAPLDYRLLGPLEVWRDSERLDLGAAKPRALLAILLLNGNRAVSTDRLIEALWPEKPPGKPQTAVQGYVSHLRKLLEPTRRANEPFTVLVTEAAGYVLRLDPEQLDLHRFARLLEQGKDALRAGKAQSGAAVLVEALSLFRGAPLADFTYERWAQNETGRIEELRLVAIEELTDARLALAQHAELVGELEGLVADHPLRERLWAQLMLALYRTGRQADALEAYQRARQLLVESLGLQPGPELQQLERAILNQDPALTAMPSRPRPVHRLPTAPNAFIGRTRALAAVTDLLRRHDVRVLTLTGPGGTGKTRLALEAARRVADEFADGAVFVSLAAVDDALLALATIAQAFAVKEADAEKLVVELRERLQDSHLLLVLDNFEQVLAAAPALAEVIAAAPALKVLVTSRSPLRLSSEREFEVTPLDLPVASDVADVDALAACESVELFLERARAVRPDLTLTEVNAAAIADLCIRLDGLPLALELAAARIKVLTPEAILARLDRRFELLVGGPADVPARQQTLRATIAWSLELLDAAEQDVFARLAVFNGGWSLEAAEAVSGADVDMLASLVDKSLVRQRALPDGEPRFSMLVTIREFALAQLAAAGEADVLRGKHADHYLGLARSAGAELAGPGQQTWLERLDVERDNLRAALDWYLLDDAPAAVELASSIFLFWYLRGYAGEGRRWVEASLDRSGPELPAELRADAMRTLGGLSEHLGEFDESRTAFEEALALYRGLGNERRIAACVNNLGAVAIQQGDYERARDLLTQSIELKQKLGDARGAALTLSNLAVVEAKLGDSARARPIHEEALRRCREEDVAIPTANVLSSLAEVVVLDGLAAEARKLVEEALEIRRRVGDKGGIADGLIVLGRVAREEGDHTESRAVLEESLALARELGDQEGIAAALEGLGDLALAGHDARLAVLLRAAADSVRQRIHAPLSPADRTWAERTLAAAEAALGSTAFAAAWSEGEETAVEAAIELARGTLEPDRRREAVGS